MRIIGIAAVAAAGAAALLAAGQAQAAGELCPTVKKIVAAADATPTWQGVSRGATGTAVPAGFGNCVTSAYSGSADYNCDLQGVTAQTVNAKYDRLVAELNACLATAPQVEGDDIATYTRWRAPAGVEVTATKVVQANADNFAVGLGVRRPF